MNLSSIGSLLSTASPFLGAASPLGALGSLATNAFGGAQTQGTDQNDPFSAVLALTKNVDGVASSGLGGGLLGSIAGMLA